MCGGCSGALWLPLHHPDGCCTLVVDEEISPLLCYINVTNCKLINNTDKKKSVFSYFNITLLLLFDNSFAHSLHCLSQH